MKNLKIVKRRESNLLPVEHGHAHSAAGGCHASDEAPLARLRVPPKKIETKTYSSLANHELEKTQFSHQHFS